MKFCRVLPLLLASLTLGYSYEAQAARIQDVTRIKGELPNQLVGMGLVFGLRGSGDGGDFQPAMRPLQQMLGKFNDPVALTKELKNASNVALVMLSVSVPPTGSREGDKLDVKVSAIAAKSLRGGRLFLCPMQGPLANSKIYALADGALTLDDDTTPTTATIKGGAVLTEDILADAVHDNQFTLVMLPNSSSFAMASAVAEQINDEVSPQTDGKPVAFAADAASVTVVIPAAESRNAPAFVARVLGLTLPNVPGAARVKINAKTGTIIFTGEVELTPTMISHRGLTITVQAKDQPVNPPGTPLNFVALDPSKAGGAKLRELVDAFNLLKVGPEDRITIVRQLHESGALRCQLDVE